MATRGSMRILDLFCGAGGAAMGYHRAGFDVVGVDNKPQKHYPFEFIQADALEYVAEHGHEYDIIHASPPCQAYSSALQHRTDATEMLIVPTRTLLIATGLPYVIENVRPNLKRVPLEHRLNGIILCGAALGLERIWRHRWFETKPFILAPPCHHSAQPLNPYKTPSRHRDGISGTNDPVWKRAMGVEWMRGKEASQAIPPVYTEFIGKALMEALCN